MSHGPHTMDRATCATCATCSTCDVDVVDVGVDVSLVRIVDLTDSELTVSGVSPLFGEGSVDVHDAIRPKQVRVMALRNNAFGNNTFFCEPATH